MSKKKKILFLIFNLEKGGGAERVMVDQINSLDKDYFDCFFCILNKNIDPDMFRSILIPAENKKVIHFGSSRSVVSWLEFIWWLKKKKFDIVYSHLFFANFVGRIAGKISGVKHVIATEHNVYLKRTYLKRLANMILSHLSYKIIAVSKSVKDYLVNLEKINPHKISVVYNGVNLNKYLFSLEKRNALRNNLGLLENDFVVLSVGQVTLQKNYDLLIDVAYEVNYVLGDKIYFFIAGRDECQLGAKLKEKVSELGLGDRVRFLGLRDDIPGLLSAADVLMMTSGWEGFGLALVEGMANGKPTLVNNISTPKEIVGQDGQYGLVARDQKEFANLLVKLKKDRLFYEKYVNLSLQRAPDFGLEENIRQITKIFLEP
jgi:glycosyltransferase involved in cell wall biosynthesis